MNFKYSFICELAKTYYSIFQYTVSSNYNIDDCGLSPVLNVMDIMNVSISHCVKSRVEILWKGKNSTETLRPKLYRNVIKVFYAVSCIKTFTSLLSFALTHFMPLVSYYIPWNYQKAAGFSCFQGDRKRPVAWNGLKKCPSENTSQMAKTDER